MIFSFPNPASHRSSRELSSTLAPVAPAQSRRPSAGPSRLSYSLAKPASCDKLSSCSSSSEYIFDESDLVVNDLLKDLTTWEKPDQPEFGRSTVTDRRSTAAGSHSSTKVFRSAEYISAAKHLARHEFKGLSRSTITAALAGSNYSYLDARRTLAGLSQKSWWLAISSRLWRRSTMSLKAEDHTLVIWKLSERGTVIPCLRSTGNGELDRELYIELIVPLKERARAAQVEKDHVLAIAMSKEEAEEPELTWTYECACCFSTAAFEEFTTCSAEGHMICFRCVQQSITEATFGQGWHQSIDKESGALRCPAVDGDACKGCILSDHMHRAMLEKKGAEILPKLDQRLAEYSLQASRLSLVRCPFCSYAEVDDLIHKAQLRVRVDCFFGLISLSLILGLYFRMIPFLIQIMVVSFLICLLPGLHQTFRDYVVPQLQLALVRFRRRRRGLKFTCKSPECGRASCLLCSKEWVDIHECSESSLVALRTQVEQAMSMAIKRVCPRCNTSFVKAAGCNKMTCPCGYKMCYVCRRDISSTDSYRHFCDHFQPDGNARPCTQCKRCNLWVSENTEEVLRAAREEAERKWHEAEKRELSGAEKVFLETGQATGKRPGGGLLNDRLPTVPEICDMLVENIFV